MKKIVIGLNLDYMVRSLIGTFLMLISLFLPVIKNDGKSAVALSSAGGNGGGYVSMVKALSLVFAHEGASKADFVFALAVLFTALSVILAVIV